jgi:hypothetical protein
MSKNSTQFPVPAVGDFMIPCYIQTYIVKDFTVRVDNVYETPEGLPCLDVSFFTNGSISATARKLPYFAEDWVIVGVNDGCN